MKGKEGKAGDRRDAGPRCILKWNLGEDLGKWELKDWEGYHQDRWREGELHSELPCIKSPLQPYKTPKSKRGKSVKKTFE